MMRAMENDGLKRNGSAQGNGSYCNNSGMAFGFQIRPWVTAEAALCADETKHTCVHTENNKLCANFTKLL